MYRLVASLLEHAARMKVRYRYTVTRGAGQIAVAKSRNGLKMVCRPWLTPKRVARICQHQLSFSLRNDTDLMSLKCDYSDSIGQCTHCGTVLVKLSNCCSLETPDFMPMDL